jgi:hypothetical protein
MKVSLYSSPNFPPQTLYVALPSEIFNGGGSITMEEAILLTQRLKQVTTLDWYYSTEEGELSTVVPLTELESRIKSFLVLAELFKSKYSLTHTF